MKLSVIETLAAQGQIIDAVRSPLVFFVLAPLIVEALLIFAETLFQLPRIAREIRIGIGLALSISVVARVYRLVVKPVLGTFEAEG